MMSANMKETLAACHDCDALYRRVPLQPGEQARCIRCNAVLYRTSRIGPDAMLAIVLTALITFVIANVFPIVELSVQGITSSSTLIGSVRALWGDEREIVATLVLATTLMVPLLDMIIMVLLTSLALMHRRPPYFAPLLRLVQTVRPWGMIEIFMLGVLVSLVKLSAMANVVPGVALWAFAILTLLLALMLSWDPAFLWDEDEP